MEITEKGTGSVDMSWRTPQKYNEIYKRIPGLGKGKCLEIGLESKENVHRVASAIKMHLKVNSIKGLKVRRNSKRMKVWVIREILEEEAQNGQESRKNE